MRVLLDESVPVRLRRHISGHTVKTVADMGWQGVKNGALLHYAAAQFDAFITVDKNLPYQQNLKTLPLSVVVLDAPSTELQTLLTLLPNLNTALLNLQANSVTWIQA